MSSATVTATVRSSPSHLSDQLIDAGARPQRQDGGRIRTVLATGEQHLAPGSQIGQRRLPVGGFDRAQLSDRASADGDDHPMAVPGPADLGCHVGPELPDPDLVHTGEATDPPGWPR